MAETAYGLEGRTAAAAPLMASPSRLHPTDGDGHGMVAGESRSIREAADAQDGREA